MGKGFVVIQEQDAGRNACSIEQIANQCNHALNAICFDHLFANIPFASSVEQNPLGHNHSAAAFPGAHGFIHVLEPGKIRIGVRRAAPEISSPPIVFKDFCAPMVKSEGRIRQDTVKLLQLAVVNEHRVAERVLSDDFELLCAMEE